MADEKPLTDLSSTLPPGVEIQPDPAAIAETGSVLDALFAAAVPDPDKPATIPPIPEPKPAATPEPKPVAGQKPGEAGAPPTTPTAAEGTPPAQVPTKDEFDKVELPPHVSQKASESFDNVKKMARERITAVEKERDEFKTKLSEIEGKVGQVDPNVEKELKELREFRQRLDVEADPSFNEYSKEILQNEESIFTKLKETGVGDAALAKIKEIGIKDLDWETVLDKLPPVARRYVENKLATNEDLQEQRTRALDEAKKNASEYLEKREKEFLQDEIAHKAAAEEHFSKVSTQLPWFKVQTPAADATPEDKAAIEANNKFFTKTQSAIKEMLNDGSPEMRAIAALGYAQMLRLQEEIPLLQSEYEAEKKTLGEKITALEAQVKEKDDFIARIKKSSKTSLRDGNAPTDAKVTAAQSINESGHSALDRLRNEQLAGQT